MSKSSKMLQWINYRIRVTIQDGRMLVGTFLAFDKHMNLVMADTEEFRKIKTKIMGDTDREQKRALGLVLLRGENIVSMTAEAAPAKQSRRMGDPTAIGPGRAQAMGRAVQMAPSGQAPAGLGGPGRGVGVAPIANMMPLGMPIGMNIPASLPSGLPMPPIRPPMPMGMRGPPGLQMGMGGMGMGSMGGPPPMAPPPPEGPPPSKQMMGDEGMEQSIPPPPPPPPAL